MNFNHIYRPSPSAEGSLYGWFEAMHSRFDLLISGIKEEAGKEALRLIYNETIRLDRMLNRFDTSSQIYALNTLVHYDTFHANTELLSILEDCRRAKEATCGYFDICINTPGYNAGTDHYIIDLDNGTVSPSREGLIFDLGGYAKGYALKKAVEILKENNFSNALLSFGGSSVYGLGSHPSGKDWQVGVENPYKPAVRAALFSLNDSAMSTSGNNLRNAGHIISPATGERVVSPGLISVSTQCPVHAEELSTALFAAGDDKEAIRKILDRAVVEMDIKRVVKIYFSGNSEVEKVEELQAGLSL